MWFVVAAAVAGHAAGVAAVGPVLPKLSLPAK